MHISRSLHSPLIVPLAKLGSKEARIRNNVYIIIYIYMLPIWTTTIIIILRTSINK